MSEQSVIRNFMSVLDSTSKQGMSALDEAVATVSKFSSWSELVNTMAADCEAYGSDGDGFLEDCCGIILGNDDTGAITGSDAGGFTTKTAESIVPEYGSWTYPTSTSFTIQGLKVNVPEKSTLDESAQWIVGALYTWWISESLTLINSSYGFNFNEAGTTVKELTISFYTSADGKMAASYYSSGQKSSELQLRINLYYFGNIDTTNPNGIGSSAALNYLDRTIAHELVHAVMSANVDWYANLPTFFKEGSAELVHGIDDKRYAAIKNLSTNPSTLRSSALSGSGVSSYAAGYIALRYLAKQANEGRDPSVAIKPSSDDTGDTLPADTVPADTVPADTVPADTVPADTTPADTTPADTTPTNTTFDGTTLKIFGSTNSDVWLGGINPFTGETNSFGNAAAVVLDATEMTDAHFLAGNALDNIIFAGNAGSSMWGGDGGNDTLAGGTGVDNFWYTTGGGSDVAINFATGSDVLTFIGGGLAVILRDGNFLSAQMTDGGSFNIVTDDSNPDAAINLSLDGTNVSAKVGNTNAANIFTYAGDGTIYLGGNASDTVNVLTAGAAVNLDGGNFASVEVLNAAFSGGANVLFGDAAANEIYSGGNGSVLWGGNGAADDILIGGTGTDIFLYGLNEGNDLIVNAEDDDVINFYNATLADVTFAQETEGGMLIGVASNVLTVAGTNNTAVTFSDGTSLRYNRAAKVWSNT